MVANGDDEDIKTCSGHLTMLPFFFPIMDFQFSITSEVSLLIFLRDLECQVSCRAVM